jgi:protein phosphatase 1 regulatory subunit 7
VNLNILDIGDNKLRKLEGLEGLGNLSELYCAKNQLTRIEGLSALRNLGILALQANQIERIEGLEGLSSLTELYLQQNTITRIENLVPQLETLDIAYNKISVVEGLEGCTSLSELWLNWNGIEDPHSTLAALAPLGKQLKTIYLADNPMVVKLNEAAPNGYHHAVKEVLPNLEQIDGYMLKQLFALHARSQEGVLGITKKEIDPRAKEILQDIIMKSEGAAKK